MMHGVCRGGCTADAKGWLKRGGGSRALVGSRGEVGMRGRGTPDIPRFGALRRDNTPSPAEFGWMIDSTMLLLELCGGGRKLAKAWATPSLRCCCWVASPMLACVPLVLSAIFSLCLCFSYLSRRRGFLRGFIDQPTQGYNGNMPSQWVRIVGVRDTRLGHACGLVVRQVPLGAGPACLGGLCTVLSIIRVWPSRVAYSALCQVAACCRQR